MNIYYLLFCFNNYLNRISASPKRLASQPTSILENVTFCSSFTLTILDWIQVYIYFNYLKNSDIFLKLFKIFFFLKNELTTLVFDSFTPTNCENTILECYNLPQARLSYPAQDSRSHYLKHLLSWMLQCIISDPLIIHLFIALVYFHIINSFFEIIYRNSYRTMAFEYSPDLCTLIWPVSGIFFFWPSHSKLNEFDLNSFVWFFRSSFTN